MASAVSNIDNKRQIWNILFNILNVVIRLTNYYECILHEIGFYYALSIIYIVEFLFFLILK